MSKSYFFLYIMFYFPLLSLFNYDVSGGGRQGWFLNYLGEGGGLKKAQNMLTSYLNSPLTRTLQRTEVKEDPNHHRGGTSKLNVLQNSSCTYVQEIILVNFYNTCLNHYYQSMPCQHNKQRTCFSKYFLCKDYRKV